MGEASLKGRLVVASPAILDPNFFRTVVLVLDHDDEGALGVVLNRPSETSVATVLAAWEPAVAGPAVVFVGGPVQPEAGVCLATPGPAGQPAEGYAPVLDWLGSVDLHDEAGPVANAVERLRIYAGYAGWGPGQLEGEVEAGDWFVLDAGPEDVFDADPRGLWPRVLRRQGGSLQIVAHFPPHPSLN